MKYNLLNQILLEKLIQEKYINTTSKSEFKNYIDPVWYIMQKTYEPIGGFGTAKTKEELIDKVDFAKLVKKDGKIIAAALYKGSGDSRKAIAKGSDGSLDGKLAVKKIYTDDVRMERAWGEFSGSAEKLMLKAGGQMVPNKYVEKLIGKKVSSLSDDGFHYTRKIGDEEHEKVIIATKSFIEKNNLK